MDDASPSSPPPAEQPQSPSEQQQPLKPDGRSSAKPNPITNDTTTTTTTTTSVGAPARKPSPVPHPTKGASKPHATPGTVTNSSNTTTASSPPRTRAVRAVHDMRGDGSRPASKATSSNTPAPASAPPTSKTGCLQKSPNDAALATPAPDGAATPATSPAMPIQTAEVAPRGSAEALRLPTGSLAHLASHRHDDDKHHRRVSVASDLSAQTSFQPEDAAAMLMDPAIDEHRRRVLLRHIRLAMRELDGGGDTPSSAIRKARITDAEPKISPAPGQLDDALLTRHSSSDEVNSLLDADDMAFYYDEAASSADSREDPIARPFMCDLVYKCMHPSSRHELDFRPYHCKAALVFADISGYSALSNLPAHAVAEAVNGYFDRMLTVAQRFGGSVLSFAGDAVLLLFPSVSQGAGRSVHGREAPAAGEHTAAERGALFESDSDTLDGASYAALQCALAIQAECASHEVPQLDTPLGVHIGVAAGAFELRVLLPTTDTKGGGIGGGISGGETNGSQRAFAFASGEVMRHIERTVETARKGEIVCTTATIPTVVAGDGDADDDDDGHAAVAVDVLEDDLRRVRAVTPSRRVVESIERYRRSYAEWKQSAPPQYIAKMLSPPPIISRLHAGIRRSELAEMRMLVVLFIQMQVEEALTAVDVSTWFGEVFDVLTSHRCTIMQILDDDKGIHVIAAMNVFESEDGSTETALAIARMLVKRNCGVKVGISQGPCFCGLIGTASDYRWDITGAVCVRACRLMQYIGTKKGCDVAIDESLVHALSDTSQATVLDKEVALKGAKDPVTVYTLSSVEKGHGTISCIAKINEYSSETRPHERQLLRERVIDASAMSASGTSVNTAVCSAIVAGTPSSGKKTLYLSALDGTAYVPILFRANRQSYAGDVARGLAAWFAFHPNPRIRDLAEQTADACQHHYSTCSAKLAAQLVAATVEEGLHTAFIVDRAEMVDEASVQIAAATLAWGLEHHSQFDGRFLWLFSLTPRSGGFSIASLTAGLALRVTPADRARAMPCALTLPKGTPSDYNGIMNSFGYWYLTHGDRRWLAEATGGDPGLFRQFLSAMPEPWMGRWHEWREQADKDHPHVFQEAAAELAKVGFAVKKYFVNKGGPASPTAKPVPTASSPGVYLPVTPNAGPASVTTTPSGLGPGSPALGPATPTSPQAQQQQQQQALANQELHRVAVYGTAYDDLQVKHPPELECDILADGTWGISDRGRKECITMLGSIAAAFDSHRGSFFDALEPHEQMLLKVIAALTHGNPPARAQEKLVLNLTKRFLRVPETALPLALKAGKDLLMIEEIDDIAAAARVVYDYTPAAERSDEDAAARALTEAALAVVLPGVAKDPRSVPAEQTLPSHAESLNATPNPLVSTVAGADLNFAASPSSGPGHRHAFWTFRSPAQRHAIAAQVTPARIHAVCKTATKILLDDHKELISFADALDLLAFMHRADETSRRDDLIRHLWIAAGATEARMGRQHGASAVCTEMKKLLLTAAGCCGLTPTQMLQSYTRGGTASPQSRTPNASSETLDMADDNAAAAAEVEEAVAEAVRVAESISVGKAEFHAPSMPTVIENAKNMEPPLVLGPLGCAIGCLTRVLAHRISQLSPQFMDRPHPDLVDRGHLDRLIDMFERIVPRITSESHEVKYTIAEETKVIDALYSDLRNYDEAVGRAQMLLEYGEKAVAPRARRVTEFASQLRDFDVVVPDEIAASGEQSHKELLIEVDALRRSFAALKNLRKTTHHNEAGTATRDALMALAVSNWSAPYSHSYMTPAKLRDALQWQWVEPIELKAIVTLYLIDIAVRHKWCVSYLVDAKLQVA